MTATDHPAATEVLGRRAGPPVLALPEARRIALAAQGFGIRRPRGAVRTEHLLGVARRLGLVQIDSVNVLTRSHYLPCFSRLGRYDAGLLDALRDAPAPGSAGPGLVEYWGHEASLMDPAIWPLFGFRMRRAAHEAWGGMREVARRHPALLDDVLAVLTEGGPMTARAVEAELAHERIVDRTERGWNWSWVKNACEHLFWAGLVTSAGRTRQFERRYARADAALPAAAWRVGPHGTDPMPEPDAFDALIELAARAQGVGTAACLRDYPRLRPEQAVPAIARLVGRGVLVPVTVQGWRQPAYLHHEAVLPDTVTARALLSPFDSLIWFRRRTAALFGFDFRLEIYTPVAKRVHGYYVLPFLYGDRLLARVDLKADRARGVLQAKAVTWEAAARRYRGAPAALDAELAELAGFLELPAVEAPTGVGAGPGVDASVGREPPRTGTARSPAPDPA